MGFKPTYRDKICILFSRTGDSIRAFVNEHPEYGFEVMDIVTDLTNSFLNNFDLGEEKLTPVEMSLLLNLQNEYDEYLRIDDEEDELLEEEDEEEYNDSLSA